MDDSVIPQGSFCYRVEKIRDGESLSEDVARFGKELREYRYHGNFKEVLCPYWKRTDYGTVRCNFLDKEVIDDEDAKAQEKVMKYFGISDASKKFVVSWALSDEIKICGVREDEGTE